MPYDPVDPQLRQIHPGKPLSTSSLKEGLQESIPFHRARASSSTYVRFPWGSPGVAKRAWDPQCRGRSHYLMTHDLPGILCANPENARIAVYTCNLAGKIANDRVRQMLILGQIIDIGRNVPMCVGRLIFEAQVEKVGGRSAQGLYVIDPSSPGSASSYCPLTVTSHSGDRLRRLPA
jgi:hypothetical protein